MVGEFLFWEGRIYRRGRRERKGGQGSCGCLAGGAVWLAPGQLVRGQARPRATQSLGLWSGIVPILNDEIPQ